MSAAAQPVEPAPPAPDGAAALEVRGVTKSFGALSVLKGIDLTLRQGEVLGLVGDNGAGKSTLVKILSGTESPTSGQVLVDGKPVTSAASLSSMITAQPAGSTLQLEVLRGGQTLTLPVMSKLSGGTPVIGVQVQENYKFPFNVRITVGDIGGPSAGMMFALGIIDMLTTENLTGGKFIAGTGEITPAGQVQPIGGIQQKMAAARSAGATVFLTPSTNCANTAGAVPAGLRLVKVSTLSQAVSDLEALKAGKSVPSC